MINDDVLLKLEGISQKRRNRIAYLMASGCDEDIFDLSDQALKVLCIIALKKQFPLQEAVMKLCLDLF